MKTESNYYNLRSYHGNYAAYNQTDSCYFNPFFHTEHLPNTQFRYLFPELARDAFDHHFCHSNKSELITQLNQLADMMVDIFDNNTDNNNLNSKIPGGYTYFGQFIDHDISAGTDRSHPFQITKEEFDPVHPHLVESEIINQRTPHFDLDSVYGGPGLAFQNFPHFYQKEDPIKFKIGTNDPNSPGELPDPQLEEDPQQPQRDLPRVSQIPMEELAKIDELKGLPQTSALIGDLRNDENLIVAQFHLAFLKFHNRLIDDLRKEGKFEDQEDLFLKARREMTLIYQWLVIHDFLVNIINDDVRTKILDQSDTIFDHFSNEPENIFMPLEFATAAYRFGHSMVRNQYDYNLNFGRGANPLLPVSTFDLLFQFTGKGAINNTRFNQTLPQNWIIQWNRFFELGNQPDDNSNFFIDRFARKIDIKLADFITTKGMQNEDISLLSPEDRAQVEVTSTRFNSIMKHLAKRNLLRGFLLNMPAAQDLIHAINNSTIGGNISITPLTEAELLNNNSQELNQLLTDTGFVSHSPLWFYILKEAEMQQEGNRMGDLGSWIVGHTIIGLIKKSKVSIFSNNWNPEDSLIPSLRSLQGVMDFLIYARVAPER